MNGLGNDEKRIVDARQVGLALVDLSQDEFEAALTGIIFNISVICGCQLPTHDAHVNALEKEFAIFLKEFGYGNLTPEEILTAFRMNANFRLQDKVETYGALFNIDFAGKVLTQYRDKRWSLDHKLNQVYEKREADKVFDEMANKRRVKVKTQYEKYVQDDNAVLDLTDCYMQLMEDDAFADRRVVELFNDHIKRGVQVSLSEMFKDGGYLENAFNAEKKAVMFLFENMKKARKTKIYDEHLRLLHPGFQMPKQNA